LLAPEYSMEVQARIPAALAAIHNFISILNPHDQPISSTFDGAAQMYDNVDEDAEAPRPNDSDQRRDMIAQKMWNDYVCICAERGIDMDAAIESDLDDDEEED
jgi:hypothetical protein